MRRRRCGSRSLSWARIAPVKRLACRSAQAARSACWSAALAVGSKLSAKIKLEWRAGYSDLAATARRKQSIASSVRPHREQASAQNVERIDVVRANLERSASARLRLAEMPQLLENCGQFAISLDVIRLAVERLSKLCRRLVQPGLGQERPAEVVMGFGPARLEEECPFIARDGRIDVALHEQRIAEIKVRQRVVGRHHHRAPKLRRRLCKLAALEERIAQIVMSIEVIGIEHDCPLVM